MKKVIDITGQKFGRLTAVRFLGTDKNRHSVWLFRCDCGNDFECLSGRVKVGNTKSCGCLSFESKSSRSRAALKIAQAKCVTHGHTGKRIYRIYKAMKSRCNNPKASCYSYYGGKGITVCDEWLQDPLSFIEWAMSHGYTDSLTIERKDSDRGYCPENCEWITQSEQARRAAIVRERNRKAVSQIANAS